MEDEPPRPTRTDMHEYLHGRCCLNRSPSDASWLAIVGKVQRWNRWAGVELRRIRTETERAERALLLSVLTPAQRAQYQEFGFITVHGSLGGHYTMGLTCFSGNICRIDHNGRAHGTCAHIEISGHWVNPITERERHLGATSGVLSVARHNLAQYLMITTDEGRWLNTAY